MNFQQLRSVREAVRRGFNLTEVAATVRSRVTYEVTRQTGDGLEMFTEQYKVGRRTLLELAALMGIDPSQTIAVGDGANDLPMMEAAGLSVAYRAKPSVRAQAQVAINTGGLDRLLEVVQP